MTIEIVDQPTIGQFPDLDGFVIATTDHRRSNVMLNLDQLILEATTLPDAAKAILIDKIVARGKLL